MNIYLLALIGLIVILAVGFVVYGLIYKDKLKNEGSKNPLAILPGIVGMYVIALGFACFYRSVDTSNLLFATKGAMTGLKLGLYVGIPAFALPLLIDAGWLKASKEALWAIIINWVVTFAILGLIIGWLA